MPGGITINSNLAALNAQRRLGLSTASLQDSFTRLSSGLRINTASDDAAGLAISESLKTDRRVFNQGVRNLNDGVSLISIADGALAELSGIVTRMVELAEQSANGTLGNAQRKAVDEEGQALKAEFFRISKTTEFNGRKLFEGDFGELRLQAGYGERGGIVSELGGAIGTGRFQEATSYTTESFTSWSTTLGDLDGDGVLDLVTAGYSDSYDGYVTVRLGLGGGSFGVATSYGAESNASLSVTLGDLNNDGVLDMVTAGLTDASDGYATIRLGIGDGSFGTAISYTTESFASRTARLGDLNGDGVLDMVTAGLTDALDGHATVRLGVGDGSFGAAISYAMESFDSRSLALGDLDGDGVLDIVTAGLTDGASDGYATIRLGIGDGSFGAATSYATESSRSLGVNLGDLDGDGIIDLVTTGQTDGSEGYTTVRLGMGDGSFGEASSYAAESLYSQSVTLGDLNGDGVLDLVTGGRTNGVDGYATIRLGLGDGSFGGAISYATESRASVSVAVDDLDGDGVLDLVTAGLTDSLDGYATIRLSETNNGVAPLLPFSLKTQADARQALPVFKRKLDQLAVHRGQIGALEARLTTAVSTLAVTSENVTAAASQITDGDVAQEAAHLVRNQILQQAGAAVLAQANQQPAIALSLLQGLR